MKKLMLILLISFFSFSVLADAKPNITKVVILKSERKLYLYDKDTKVKEYRISLGFEPVGAKDRQGDGKTPEGNYKIIGRNPQSLYHKSLRVSYPSKKDQDNARKKGIKNLGGDIMIHGLPNGRCAIGKAHLLSDWTLGCIAVTCEEIDEIWKLVKDGTTVEIKP